MVDVGDMVGTAMPYLSAAAAAYGAGVVERVGEKAEVATADATARFGARLALLACAFFGLLVMHTVGHAAVTDVDHHVKPSVTQTHPGFAFVAAPSQQPDDCGNDGCAHRIAMPGGQHDGMTRWDLCVAILSILALAALLAALLVGARRGRSPLPTRRPQSPRLRAGQELRIGLTVTALSVVRT